MPNFSVRSSWKTFCDGQVHSPRMSQNKLVSVCCASPFFPDTLTLSKGSFLGAELKNKKELKLSSKKILIEFIIEI